MIAEGRRGKLVLGLPIEREGIDEWGERRKEKEKEKGGD